MAWIHMIPEEDADDELKAVYQEVAGRWGGLDAIMQIHSLNPQSLMAHQLLYKILMYGKSGLSRVQREMIALVVSSANKCYY